MTGVELQCDDCRQPYCVWFANNDVWNLVMGGPDAKGDPGGMLCPRCFTLRAEAVYKLPIWNLRLDRVNRELQLDFSPDDGLAEKMLAILDAYVPPIQEQLKCGGCDSCTFCEMVADLRALLSPAVPAGGFCGRDDCSDPRCRVTPPADPGADR